MVLDERLQQVNVVGFYNRFQVNHAAVAESREDAVFVEDKGDSTTHAGRKVSPSLAQDDSHAAGHVFAAMVAHTFHDGVRAAVAHRESLSGHSSEIRFASGGAVQNCVANDDVVFGNEGRTFWWVNHQPATGQTLANIVVGIAFERQCDAFCKECAKALACRTAELDPDRIFGEAGIPVATGDFSAEHRADSAVGVADGQIQFNRRLVPNGTAALFDQLHVQHFLKTMILRGDAVRGDALGDIGFVEDARKIQPASFPVIDGLLHVKQFGMPYHVR